MMSSSENYDQDFPLLRKYDTTDDKGVSSHQPKILNSPIKDADRTLRKMSSAEEVLNWRSENLTAQNKILKWIDKRTKFLQSSQDALIARLTAKIQQIRNELMEIIKANTVPMTVLYKKKRSWRASRTSISLLLASTANFSKNLLHGNFPLCKGSQKSLRLCLFPNQGEPLFFDSKKSSKKKKGIERENEKPRKNPKKEKDPQKMQIR